MNIQKNRLVMILPYFGRLPKYFNFFLKSLTGKNFDVLFVSDLSVLQFPENFRIVRMTLPELAHLAQEKMTTEVNLFSPRRLCDFKPMYGHIFEDYIKDYEYWAFGDCDLVYGNRMKVLVDEICNSACDAFSCRKSWTTGSFCAFRNNEMMRLFYQRMCNWREVAAMTQLTFVNFDEIGNQVHYGDLEMGRMTVAEATKYRDCLTAALWRATDVKFIHEDRICELSLRNDFVQMTKTGDLFLSGNVPIALFHFIHVKGKWFKQLDLPVEQIGDYRIERSGFYLLPISQVRYVLSKAFRYVVAFCLAAVAKIGRVMRA